MSSADDPAVHPTPPHHGGDGPGSPPADRRRDQRLGVVIGRRRVAIGIVAHHHGGAHGRPPRATLDDVLPITVEDTSVVCQTYRHHWNARLVASRKSPPTMASMRRTVMLRDARALLARVRPPRKRSPHDRVGAMPS